MSADLSHCVYIFRFWVSDSLLYPSVRIAGARDTRWSCGMPQENRMDVSDLDGIKQTGRDRPGGTVNWNLGD